MLGGMGHETADLVDRVGVEKSRIFWAAHSSVRFRHSRARQLPASNLNGLRSSRVAAFSSSSGVLRPRREHGVDLRHHGGAFSHGGRNPFGRAGANVADREHARPRGLERQRRAVDRADVVGEAVAGDDEALRDPSQRSSAASRCSDRRR